MPADDATDAATRAADRLVDRVARRYGAEWVEAVTHGCSDAVVHRLVRAPRTDLFLKQATDVDDETARLRWLGGTGIDCPEVVDAGPGWLLTVRLPGRDAAQPWSATDRPRVLDAMADGLTALHALDPQACPFDTRYPAHDRTERVVVAHGDYCCPNVMIDPTSMGFAGVLDLGWLGVADPYVDLATTVMTLAGDLNPQYGGLPAARRVFARYGAAFDDPRIDDYLAFYRSDAQ
jgi:aminoglycoside phosphotransferase